MPRIALNVTSQNSITGYIEWTESNVSATANTSVVSAKLVYMCNGVATTGGGRSAFTLTINGETHTYTGAFSISPGETKEVFGGTYGSVITQTISHNSDGSKSIVISGGGYVEAYVSGSWQRTVGLYDSTGSATVALTAIARNGEFGPIYGSTIGSPVTIYINRKGNYYHVVEYDFGTIHGALSAGTTDGVSFTPSRATFGAQIPNAVSGVCTLTLKTYSGSTIDPEYQIGDAVTTNLTLTMPEYVPSISNILSTDTAANDTGKWIQNVSMPSFWATVSGMYGSTVSEVVFEIDGQGKSGTISNGRAASGAFDPLFHKGDLTLKITVRDSRGRIATNESITLNVLEYSKPVINASKAIRSVITDTDLVCTLSAEVSPLAWEGSSHNTLEAYAVFAVKGSPLPSPVSANAFPVPAGSIGVVDISKTQTISAASSYDVRIIVRDKFYDSYADYSIGTADVIMDITDQGYIGINKRWEHGALDINGKVCVENGNYYVSSYGKTSISDGNAGSSLGAINLTLQSSQDLYNQGHVPYIGFYGVNGATAPTAKISEVWDGYLTIEDKDLLIKHDPARTNGQASAIQFVPLLDPTTISYSGSTGMVDNYLKAWIGYVCNNLAGGGANSLYIGSALNGSKAIIFWFVYDMGTLSSDLPQYSTGLVIPYAQSANMRRFGTANYVFWADDVGGGGGSYANADTTSF